MKASFLSRSSRTLPFFLSALCLTGAVQTSRGDFVQSVQEDTRTLTASPSRMTGTEGHAQASGWLHGELTQLEGVRVWTHEFPVMMPKVHRAELSIETGPFAGTHALYPIWPDLIRNNTTPPEGLSGGVLYVGDASTENLPAIGLKGNIAAMEMSSYANWKKPFLMKASAVLLLGSPDDQMVPPSVQPLYFPRYYIPEGPLADAIRENRVTIARVDCKVTWEEVTAKNHYALVMPASGIQDPLPALGFVAAYDAMSIVLDQAPGADNALDAAFLLNQLRETAQNPPARPLLFAFVDAVSINQLGMRHFLTMLNVTGDDPTRKTYAEEDRKIMEDYEEILASVTGLGTGKEALDQLNNKRVYRDVQRAYKDVIGPELLDIKEKNAKLRQQIYQAMRENDEEQIHRLNAVLELGKKRVASLNRILVQVLTPAEISEEILPEALETLEKTRARIVAQAEAQRARLTVFQETDTLRKQILRELGIGEDQSPITFLVGIDLSDAGFTVGPGLYGAHLEANATITSREFTRWLKVALEDNISSAVNRSAISGTSDPKGFNVGNTPLLTSPAASFNIPSVTWKTLSGLRRRVDTPQDKAERLDWERLRPQILASNLILDAMIADPAFTPDRAALTRGSPAWRRAWGSIVQESVAETVPRTPQPGFLVTMVPDGLPTAPAYGSPGIRRQEVVVSKADGGFTFFPGAGSLPIHLASNQVKAFQLDEQGRIRYTQADPTSMIQGTVATGFDLNQVPNRAPARLLSFECTELNGPEFFDPRFLEPLNSFNLIDPMTGGRPKRSQFSVMDGQMWGALMPDRRWQLILRAGTAANRMILMNLDKELRDNLDMNPREAIQSGFALDEPLPSFPAHIAAQDFYTIDAWRLGTYQKAGITSQVLAELHANTGKLLKQVDEAIAADDGGKAMVLASAALSNELRVYEALLAMGGDVTRGAIFLMILIVLFSVAMERLMFSCVKIGNRISISFAIFSVMTFLLWSFHPAFRITNQPLIIVMAFAVLLLSLLVILMIFRKFEADLDEMRSGSAEKGGAQTSRGGVIGSAIWLGIANMRKRKLRTFLTATTIVLITFALLCFSSSTTYQNKRQFEVSDTPPPYSGILLKRPGLAPLHPRSLPTVASMAEGLNVAPRYWWTSTIATWSLQARNIDTGTQASLKAALGLSPNEAMLTAPDRLLPNWEVFSQGNGCYLSEATAEELGLKIGDRVGVGGQELMLAGTFSGNLESELMMLDGQSLLPYDFTIEADEEGSAADPSRSGNLVGMEDEGDKLRVPPDDLILLSADLAKELGGSLRSIGLATDSHEETLKQINRLSEVLAFPLYYGTESGTSVIAATPLIPKVPRNLIIPLVLAALIIFNTMLNSVAERKKEIHIYTSLGLAPVHVGMLFLSEAVTYGLMGSVFGYVAGQGLAAVLTSFDLMGGITLNYSGSSVIVTMGLVIGVVVLSSIVPALMAGKLASPSDEMKWAVPEPVKGVLKDQLPFTIGTTAAPGLMAFIHDYIVAHEEGTIGYFASADTRFLQPGGNTVAGIQGTVWLAPYDLGVRQHFTLRVEPEGDDFDDICKITIEITHEAGQPKTWWRQNRIFLGSLRQQLLGWRKVPVDRILEYIDSFKAMSLRENA